MKCFLVVVSVIAVFTADSRDFPDISDTGPPDTPDEHFPEEPMGTNTDEDSKSIHENLGTDIRSFGDEGHNFPDEPLDHESADGIQDSNDGSIQLNDESQGLGQHFIEERKGVNAAQLRGKQQNKILKQIIKDLMYIKYNITDIGEELKVELQSIRDNQNNFTDIGKDLRDELQSAMGNLTDSNSELKKEVSSMKQNIDNKTSLIISKLDSIIANHGCNDSTVCNEGFFKTNGSRKCYKTFRDTQRSWSDAKIKCQQEGLILSRPSNAAAISLRKDILKKDGYGRNWLDARGDGSTFRWQHDGSVFRTDNPGWHPGYPGCVTTSCCLSLQVYETSYPNQPYITSGCTSKRYTLCEA